MQSVRANAAQSLAAGDVVRTDEDDASVAEIAHRNGAVTRLDRSSEAVVDRNDEGDRPRIVVTLGPGRSWHHTGPLDDPAMYEARCPAAVATARQAVFTVTCSKDGSAHIAAVRGNVVVRGSRVGSIALSDGQEALVTADGSVEGPMAASFDQVWVTLNTVLDDEPAPADEVPEAEAEAEPELAAASAASSSIPRWVGRAAAVAAAAGFVALLATTFLSAQNGDSAGERAAVRTKQTPSSVPVAIMPPPVAPLPAGAAAMIRAAQDRRVAPETTTTEARTTTTTAAPPPAP
ncbi:MAG TPA: hypothetical protein VGO92_06850, partial [Acidimicrobiales bacterium]|nr:hypothetical protein [Acidimicrobiales bacterium]